MSVIANLDINLRGNTGGIEKAADVTSKKLSGVKNAVNQHASAVEGRFAQMRSKLGSTMAGLGSAFSLATKGIAGLALAAVGAGTALFGFGRKEADAIQQLGRTADKIGISTEALAGLQHAAKLAGVETGEMDSLLSGMVGTLAKTGMSGGEAGRAIARIGINFADLQGLAPEEQFMRIAGALADVEDQGKKLVLANEIGGETLARFVSVYKGGADDIKKAMQEASELGLTVSREEALQVEQSNQAMTRMKESFTGLFRTAAIAIAPLVKLVADGLTNAMKWVNSFRDKILEFAFSVEFTWKHFGDYANLAFDRILYGATKLVNQLAHLFTEVLPEALKAAWDGAIEAISGDKLDAVIDRALARIKKKMASRKEGAIEANLRQTYERAAKALEAQRKKAVETKMEDIKASLQKPGGGGVSEVLGLTHNAVAERGSQEAFSIIAGYQKDKMLKTANDQLTELRKANKILDRILNKRAAAAVKRGRV